MRPTTRAGLLLVAGVLLLGGCSDSAGPATDFVLNWLKWKQAAPQGYDFNFQRLCFCGGEATLPVRITVSNGRVVAVVRQSDNQPVPQAQIDDFFRITIDSLFGIIAEAIDRDAADINVRYDPQLRYPATAQIDYATNIADEELGFTAQYLGPRALEGTGGIP